MPDLEMTPERLGDLKDLLNYLDGRHGLPHPNIVMADAVRAAIVFIERKQRSIDLPRVPEHAEAMILAPIQESHRRARATGNPKVALVETKDVILGPPPVKPGSRLKGK